MAIFCPRSLRISRSRMLTTSRPRYRICPPVILPGGRTSFRMDSPRVDLPHPDSPTRPRASPLYRVRLTSSTAPTVPMAMGYWIDSPLISRIGSVAGCTARSSYRSSSLGLRISARPSPSMVNPRARRLMAAPGKVIIHQVPEGRNFLPMDRSMPQSGMPAGSPSPI